MTDNTQPEALDLADWLEAVGGGPSAKRCAALLREQHARIADLEAQLEAIGAGGVTGPLVGQPQAMPDLSQLTERGARAWAGVDAQALREGRWYMVTHDGVATLCEDRRDAEKEAKDADMAWPHSGPHRAVQLVEASTAGFTAADMATASAQGFRDGVASPSANAGEPSGRIKEPYTLAEIKAKIASSDYSAEMLLQHAMLLLDSASLSANAGEPVAWQYRSSRDNGAWFDCTKERFEMRCTQPEIWETRALYAAPPTAQAEGWISVDERLPEVGVTVLVYEPFRHGEDWPDTVRIFFDYICPDYEGWHNHCESYEHFMIVGGSNACGPDVTCTGPSEKAPYTHWMPLPPPPTSAEGVEHG